MAERLSLGPVQVGTPTVDEINSALSELVTRIDALKGLSGPIELRDAMRIVDEDGNVIHAWAATS